MKSNRAFTLIELSIVLVIIGLIVGGVLVSRDLIAASEVRGQITQIEKLNSSVNTFRDKYGGIPGDLPVNLATQFNFTIADCTGVGTYIYSGRNGNTIIEGAGTSQPYAMFMGENELFWLDLSMAKLADVNFTDSRPGICSNSLTTTTPGRYVPNAKIANNSYVTVYGNSVNWFMLSGISGFSGASTGNGIPNIPVVQAYNFDKKIDDGLPTVGRVITSYITTSQNTLTLSPNAASPSSSTCYDTTSNAYSITQNNGGGTNCALSVRVQ